MGDDRETILFIEDDKVDRMLFERLAREKNFQYAYIMASSLQESIEILRERKFDAVVTDYLLGDGTAFDIFDKVIDTPIIVVTGAGDEEIAVKAMKKGAYDYLIKDSNYNYLKILTITVEKAIRRKETEDELKKHRERLEEMVELRTAELQKEIDERKRAEEEKNKAFIETKNLQREIMQIAEKERQRIGQDLHDEMGQNLTAATFLIEALREKMIGNFNDGVSDIEQIDNLIRKSIVQTRNIAKMLCPVEMEKNGLRSALNEMASATKEVFNVSCSVLQEGNFFIDNNQAVMHLFYIAREAVTNAIKHGKAENIHIRLISNNLVSTMIIKDDGEGVTETKTDIGMGLRIMKYRANIIGAEFNAGNHERGGFEVRVQLK